MRGSLLQKLLLLFLGVFFGSVGILTFSFYDSSQIAILNEFQIRGKELSKAIASESAKFYVNQDIEGFTSLLQSIGEAEGVLAILAHSQSQELWLEYSTIELTEADIAMDQHSGTWQHDHFLADGALIREFGFEVFPSPTVGQQTSFPLGWIRIFLDRASIETKLHDLLIRSLTSSGAILSFGGLILVVLLRRSLQHIPPLIEATQRVAKGELTTTVQVSSDDELGQLALWFNQMTQELHTTTVSKNYVDNIIQSMMDSLVVLDNQGVIRTVNQATLNLLGYKDSELIGKPFGALVGLQEPSSPGPLFKNIMARPAIPYTETQYQDKQGTFIPVLFSSTHIIRRKEENVQGIVCLAQDMREQKRAAALLEFSHGLLEAIHQAQNRFIAIQDPYTTFQELLDTLIDLTRSQFGFLGEVLYTPEGTPFVRTHAISDISWDESTKDQFDQSAPNLDFMNLDSLFGVVVTTGNPVLSNQPNTDHRSGGLPPGHPPLTAFLGLPFYAGDTLVGMLALANRAEGYEEVLVDQLRPILSTCGNLIEAYRNEQRRASAESALRESVERFDVAVRGSRDGLWDAWSVSEDWFNPQNPIYYSPRFKELLGFSEEEFSNVVGSWVAQLYEEDREGALKELQAHLLDRTPYDSEYRMITKSGAIRWYAGRGQAIWDKDGTPIRISGSFSDITERKRSEQALQEAHAKLQNLDAMRTQFFADISHELRTPLTVIRGEAEVTLRGQDKPIPEYKGTLQRITQLTNEVSQLVNDLLFLARSETGTIPINLQPVELLNLLTETCQDLDILAFKKSVVLSMQGEQEMEIQGDPQRLKQLLIILLDNAIKYTPKGGAISVTLEPTPQSVKITITDQGMGIPESDLPHIFERFYRVRRREPDLSGGAGLGLPIAKWIVDIHQGSMLIESEERRGTVVTLLFSLKKG